MLNFRNDYSESAHESILRYFLSLGTEKLDPYGSDRICAAARDKIRAAFSCPAADIVFLTGGTQTNVVVLDSLLHPYEGVIAAETGHVSVHEAGAVEFTGHKVLELPQQDGKLHADTVRSYLETYFADDNCEHIVRPGAVYISHPTEYGTLYTKSELTALHEVCREYRIPLYIDGARLGYALAADGTDLTAADIAALCDVFYIGGTKVGALCGEAVVFPNGDMPAHYITIVKQHCALLAKGWVLGAQFDALFTDDLYFKISRNAIDTANAIRAALKAKGYRLYMENPTNQIFVILDAQQRARLEKDVLLGFMNKYDDAHTVMRICTSWATSADDVSALISLL